jgi:hypothetical protein
MKPEFVWGNRTDHFYLLIKERVMLNASQEKINSWRNNADVNSPAGPLFVSGQFAESDIVSSTNVLTAVAVCGSGHCGTACSGSAHGECC